MNQLGNDYLKSIKQQASEYNRVHRDKKPPLPSFSWSDSMVQERIMRLGREVSVYEIDKDDTRNIEAVAIATLLEDFMKRASRP